MDPRTYEPFKRGIDLVVGSLLLLISAPVQGVIALLVSRKLGSPVLFRQERPGKDEKIFELIKFRTMLEADIDAGLTTDASRLTTFGSWLRSTSLDELPTLWNVLKGDMSLIGPRPLLVQYLDRYTPEQRRRHDVRPGVTGLAQVSGRNAITWDEKFAKDIEYVDRHNFALDVSILVRTLAKVLQRDGITDAETATMSEFMGETARVDG